MRIIAVLALLLAVAACETVPRPFKHEEGMGSALARPKLGRGIALHSADDMVSVEALSEAVIKAFEEREIPVTLRRGPGFGRVIEVAPAGDAVLWRLLAADGAEMHRLSTPAALSGKLAAAQVAARFHPFLEDPDAKPQLAPGRVLAQMPKVRIEPMKGLPGDGDTALPLALTKALARERVEIAADAAYTVVGVVTIAQVNTTDDNVSISWLIKQGSAAGPQLARIDQSGAVPRGRLNLGWGSMARDIAEGGASGVAEVLRAAERNRKEREAEAGPRQFTEPRPADIGKPESSDQTDPARTSPPPPEEPAPPAAAASPQAPPQAMPAKPVEAQPVQPKSAKATKPAKSNARKKVKPAPAKTAKAAPRTKPDR
ncbi:MAG: hypothetical protein FD176_599 [Rhodospirillaceae bacterium]|nr:MAG: hypothetical protein FD176_599 [Rhodospirillaceae bacterium]TNC94692.1 MAG: Uncharacterized protein FD119_2936 [Stygiobacter sp.]